MPVEQLRNLLLIALCFTGFLVWQAWQQDYAPRPAPVVQQAPAPAAPTVDSTQLPDSAGIPSGAPVSPPAAVPAGAAAGTATAGSAPAAGQVPSAAQSEHGRVVRVSTDVLRAEIDTNGGNLVRVDLLNYPVATDDDTPFTLIDPLYPDRFVALLGMRSDAGPAAPAHTTAFAPVGGENFALGNDADAVEVPLEYRGEDGLVVRKVFRFERDSYRVQLRYEVENTGEAAWTGSLYGILERPDATQSVGLFQTYTYTGGILSTPEAPYEKISFSDMHKRNLQEQVSGGWLAMIEHYFTVAIVPDQARTNVFYTRKIDGLNPLYNFGVVTQNVTIAAGASDTLSLELYAGPKIAKRLEAVVPGLERTVDYGWLWLIAQPLFWLLDNIHDFVGNWGWSVIILTILIKLAFFQLSAASYKSMARMRKLQPRMVQLRERYGDDKQKLNQAMMELYKTEKVNPLGGCLPILVQIPVFIALYWVLLESVELRQAPFMLWIKDMSEHDPYFVLPLLMGASMFFQQKLNPAPPDPMQARIMQFLPIVFTALFLFFPAGLVLYWFVNNLLSIAQQWVITRKIVGPEPPAAK